MEEDKFVAFILCINLSVKSIINLYLCAAQNSLIAFGGKGWRELGTIYKTKEGEDIVVIK